MLVALGTNFLNSCFAEDEARREGIIDLEWDVAEKEGVHFISVQPGSVKNILSLNGEVSLNGDSVVHVFPRFAGVIKQVEKKIGDQVKAGDLLTVIQSNESLSLYQIHSEVDGTIMEKDASRGEFVKDDKLLFTIADLKTVWVNAAVYPADLDKVKVGSRVLIESKSVGNLTSNSTEGQVSYVRQSLSELTRTAMVRIAIGNLEQRWFPGMFVTVKVLGESHDAKMVVPKQSVVTIENVPSIFVQVISHGHHAFEVRKVELGLSDDRVTEVLSGLKDGEIVAAENPFILKAELGKSSADEGE